MHYRPNCSIQSFAIAVVKAIITSPHEVQLLDVVNKILALVGIDYKDCLQNTDTMGHLKNFDMEILNHLCSISLDELEPDYDDSFR